MSDIGDYYDRKERERREAWKKFQDALAQGAPIEVVRQLREAYDRAAYTGD